MNYEKELYLLHLSEQVFSSLISVSNKLQATGDKYGSPFTSRQYMTLLAILHLPEEETTMINIANKLGATKQNVAQIINSLMKKEFVSVSPSLKDKRAVNVHITELGINKMVEKGQSIAIDFMADAFKDFETDELEVLWKLLKKLYRFDGVELDGLEADVKIPNAYSDQEIKTYMERFSSRRNEKKTV